MEAYILKHNDFRTRIASRSGGAFTAISDSILNNGGMVYGTILENNIFTRHIRTNTTEGRNLMRGSKYIQSSMGECYKNALVDLKDGKQVLFTGTPCQIAGLKAFVGKEYDNLITMDIFCHGVPSPKVWRDYFSYMEGRCRKKIVKVDFRNKYKFGWAAHKETMTFEDNSSVNSGIFTNLFYSHKILRPSCYECPYKSLKRISDISVGDAWGIDKVNPEFNDDNGVSIVLFNTDKAMNLLHTIKCATVKRVDITDYMQPPLQYSFKQPNDRKAFWKHYESHSFEEVVKKYRRQVRKKKIWDKVLNKLHG